MAIDRGWWSLGACACGLGLLAFALLPGAWPNPLPQGELDLARPANVQPLRGAVEAVDAACLRGDVTAFAAAVTPAHRAAIDRSLAPFGRGLDDAVLRQIGARQAAWLDAEALAGTVVGTRAAIAVTRPDGDGAQVLTFEWDGQRLRLDGSVHAGNVRDAAAARAAVAAAVAGRR